MKRKLTELIKEIASEKNKKKCAKVVLNPEVNTLATPR